MEKEILDKIAEIYYFTQYGKLMPGFIHNINGRITSLDSKIQLSAIKMKMKIKKLEKNKDNYSEETYLVLEKEYGEMSEQFDSMKQAKNELNGLMSMLNRKVSGERSGKCSGIDLTEAVKSFHDFFMFYKRYKHDTTVEFDFDSSSYITMNQKDFNFILFSVVKNGVDATYGLQNEENYIKYSSIIHPDCVELKIFNNGIIIEADMDIFQPLHSDKYDYKEEAGVDMGAPLGVGLDMYFLKKILDSYQNVQYSVISKEGEGTTFSIKFMNSDKKK